MSGVDLPGALTDLSDQEKNLVDAARRGTRLTCSKLGHEELGRSTAPEHLIRAEVIRELLLGLHGDLDPRGIWLSGARITGDLDVQFIDAPVVLALLRCVFDRPAWFIGAHFKWIDLDGTRMPTFQADALRVDGSLMMRAGFTATGDSISGAVNLWGASIGRSLELDGATLTNNSGPAISAQGLSVGGPMFLRRGFSATGRDHYGMISLAGARIAGVLDLVDSRLTNVDGRALLNLEGTQISEFYVRPDLICPQGLRPGRRCESSDRQVDIAGFTYTSLVEVGWEQWLHVLRCHTDTYRPQPYQQLAASCTALGHDRDAREVLIAQQQDHRDRGRLGRLPARFAHRLWGALAGYGYRTSRTALALLAVLLLAAGLGLWAGHTATGLGRFAAERPATGQCSTMELVGLGIDRGLPLASTGIRAKCDFDTSSTAGQWFTGAIWVLQAAVWALATLALAGYTGLVRKIR